MKKHTETWSTFIKCILKHGLKDSELGVAGVGLLTAVCSLRYSTQVRVAIIASRKFCNVLEIDGGDLLSEIDN